MNTHRSLRNVIARRDGSAACSGRPPSPGTARARLAHALAVPALVLASLGATAAASPGAGGHLAAGSPHPAGVLTIRPDAATSCALAKATVIGKATVTAGVTRKRPWMYAITSGKPWMYAIVNGKPWMYAIVNGKPWMYSPAAGHQAGSLACAAPTHRVSA